MNELSLIVFAALFGLAAAYHLYESRNWRAERRDLLNRIMSRSYAEFTYNANVAPSEVPNLSTDALEAAWYEAQAREAAAKDAAGQHLVGVEN